MTSWSYGTSTVPFTNNRRTDLRMRKLRMKKISGTPHLGGRPQVLRCIRSRPISTVRKQGANIIETAHLSHNKSFARLLTSKVHLQNPISAGVLWEYYTVKISIEPLPKALGELCAKTGAKASNLLVDLTAGQIVKPVLQRLCQPGNGAVPKPSEIKLSCACLELASMCKHRCRDCIRHGARLESTTRTALFYRVNPSGINR